MLLRLAQVLLACTLMGLPACSSVDGDAAPAPPPTPATAASPTAGPEPSPAAPNIVVFMTDDQTVDQLAVMAGVQARLVEQGMTFTQAVVNLPSCCPSRATFLTGQHAVNHGVLTNTGVSGGFRNFEGQEATLATALQAGGYRTVFVGKYLNGFGLFTTVRYTPPGWSDFRGLVAPTEVLYHSPTVWVNGSLLRYTAEVHAVDLLDDMAAEAITAAMAGGGPLFAVVSYPAPHAQAGEAFGGFDIIELLREAATIDDETFLRPPVPAARHRGSFADAALPRSASFNELDVSDKPAFLHRRVRAEDDLEPVRVFHRAALESLQAVDESVNRLMELIDELDPGRDTWFVFTSDNGILLGQHRHFGVKYFPYEENVRVPLVVRGPGVEPGARSPALVSNVDLAPTILDIAGVAPPREPDGRSLLPLLLDEEAPGGRAVLIQGFEFKASSPPYRAVHTGDSVYVEWIGGERELYDLVADPLQLDNLAGEPSAAELEARNEALLRALEGCAGAACAAVGSDLAPPDHPARGASG